MSSTHRFIKAHRDTPGKVEEYVRARRHIWARIGMRHKASGSDSLLST